MSCRMLSNTFRLLTFTTLNAKLNQDFLPTLIETSCSAELEAHVECCCCWSWWWDWGGGWREGGETGKRLWCWEIKESKSMLEEGWLWGRGGGGGGGLSKWSERGSSLIPLSQGDGAHRGELEPDPHSHTFNKESRKWSAPSSLWDSNCRKMHVHTEHMDTTHTHTHKSRSDPHNDPSICFQRNFIPHSASTWRNTPPTLIFVNQDETFALLKVWNHWSLV